MKKLDFFVTDVMNVDKNVKKSCILKIQSGVSRVSGDKSSLEFAKNAKNHGLEMAFPNALSRVKNNNKNNLKCRYKMHCIYVIRD